jgi:hypothetical protein
MRRDDTDGLELGLRRNEEDLAVDEWAIIHVVTRAQLLEDGSLVDVSEMARQAGIRYPVAVTRALWEDINDIPARYDYQDWQGRLWDVLSLFVLRAKALRAEVDCVLFDVLMPTTENLADPKARRDPEADDMPLYRVKAICGPGDDAAPVLTFLRPDED